ncbi:MAG: CheY-like chemotaxis protein [Mariniblastus sp.]|jgi:CheY-like chemotaxis protein
MKEKIILIIDDSATIRRLVDNELSNAGYHVLLAPTAEEGIETAQTQSPDLIILDHQLPGTTGYEVCCMLLKNPDTAKIPVVASSTLRKKAYAEYVDCDNVVDMLPKPYTPEALVATVENAINTAEMVVNSQCDGSAVPEVIDQQGESDLSGAFGCFGLREIVDLLNNGGKSGALEVQTDRCRVSIFVDKGRVQAVTASGVDPQIVADHMPSALAELAPVIKFTVAGRRGSEVEGLVELLDSKVLDPRLLRKLLRLQAAVLLRFCFTEKLQSFRFDKSQAPSQLFLKLPLDASLLSLLVEGALICSSDEIPPAEQTPGFVRKAIRGQNMDRGGLSSRHMRLMSLVAEPIPIAQLAQQLNWPPEEVLRVAHGFELAELIERCPIANTTKVFAMISDSQLGQRTEAVFQRRTDQVTGKVARDWLSLRLLLRRSKPDALLVEIDENLEQLQQLCQDPTKPLAGIRLIGIGDPKNGNPGFDQMLSLDCDEEQLLALLTARPTSPTAAAQAQAQAQQMPQAVEGQL